MMFCLVPNEGFFANNAGIGEATSLKFQAPRCSASTGIAANKRFCPGGSSCLPYNMLFHLWAFW